MRIVKLSLYGHVHNKPNQKITSFYSWPTGITCSEALKIVADFDKAFVLNRAVLNG